MAKKRKPTAKPPAKKSSALTKEEFVRHGAIFHVKGFHDTFLALVEAVDKGEDISIPYQDFTAHDLDDLRKWIDSYLDTIGPLPTFYPIPDSE